jgi:mycofactocin glycosyltransferase
MTQYGIDASVRRVGDGRVLIGGSPLKLFRLSEAGARLVDRIERGDAIDAVAGASLIDRLLDAGAIHPSPGQSAFTAADVTVVIPAYARSAFAVEEILSLAESLGAVAATVIVIDDCSPQPIEFDEPPASNGDVTIMRLPTNGGPGAARSAGLAHVSTPLVAFVDTDVSLPNSWLDPLLAHFSDPLVAMVAPRVGSAALRVKPRNPWPGLDTATDSVAAVAQAARAPDSAPNPIAGGWWSFVGDETMHSLGPPPPPSAIERYETVRSPLDLGPAAARVRAGTRVSYVPSACVVCRVEALTDVGGFDPALRFGEDVDLVWRLDESRWRVRYEPGVVVHHKPRPTRAAWARQRFDYGSSAAALEQRHRGALAPVRISGWSLASWVALAAGWPVIGGAIAATTTVLLARKLRDVPDGPREALRLAGLGHLYAGRSLAAGLTRAWWPITLAAALVSRRARRAAVAAAIVPPLIDWLRTRPRIDLPTYLPLRLADDVSYGTGLWFGAFQARSAAALFPDLTSWPATKRPGG